jgi:YHS domain
MLGVMLLRPGHYAHAHQHASDSGPIGSADPVCGMAIDPTNASRSAEYQGQTYYF